MPSEIIGVSDLPADMAALHAYWDSLRNGRFAPSWSEFDLVQVPSRLLPTTMVVDLADPIRDSRYRFWGSGLTKIHGRDMTGKCPYDLQPPSLGQQVLAHHMEAIEEKTAIARTFAFKTARGLNHRQTLIRFPLSDDDVSLHQLVIVVEHAATTIAAMQSLGETYADIFPDSETGTD